MIVALRLLAILDFDEHPLRASPHVLAHFTQTEHSLAEATLAQRVVTINRLVFDLLLFDDSESAALAYDLHVGAIVQFVGAQQKFVIRQLIVAPRVVTFKPDLGQSLLF